MPVRWAVLGPGQGKLPAGWASVDGGRYCSNSRRRLPHTPSIGGWKLRSEALVFSWGGGQGGYEKMEHRAAVWTEQDVTTRRAECQAKQKKLDVIRVSADSTNQLNRLTLATLTGITSSRCCVFVNKMWADHERSEVYCYQSNNNKKTTSRPWLTRVDGLTRQLARLRFSLGG